MASPNSLYESAYNGDYDLIKTQVDDNKSLIQKNDENGRSLLHWAAISGNLKLVMYLTEMGSDIDASEDTEATPLVLASSAGRLEVCSFLIKQKADVNHKTSQGHSALQYAASKNWLKICILLIENNADVNIVDIRGATALHRAASKGNLDVVKYLLSIDNINLDCKDAYGNTPLHLACEEDRQEEAKLLVKRGARTDMQNRDKQTALDLCTIGLRRALTTTNE